jgi:hypothetical protein
LRIVSYNIQHTYLHAERDAEKETPCIIIVAWGPTFICSLDGTDFKVWEPKHPTLPQDCRQMSFKMKHAALKYEIAVCNIESQICWVSRPYRGAKHDLSVFRDGGLKERIQIGKLLNMDRGYQSSRLDE